MRKNNALLSQIDWPLFIAFISLLIFGIATVYSVALNEEHPNIFAFSEKYGKQMLWLGVSLFLGLIIFLIDVDVYRKFAVPIYIFTLLLLVIVLFMPPINGARAWIGIGSMGIQPAEFAKISTALLLSKYISGLMIKHQTINTVLTAVGILGAPVILVAMQPDAGTLVVFSSFLFVLYREGMSFDPLILKLVNRIPGINLKSTWVGNHFIPLLFIVVILAVLTLIIGEVEFSIAFLPGIIIKGGTGIIFTLAFLSLLAFLYIRRFGTKRDRASLTFIIVFGFVFMTALSSSVSFVFSKLARHQKDRIEMVLGLKEDPNGKDYNRNRAMAAVGSGGAFGKGYKQASVSSVESNHVPESETDFIFCPFAEEWGFLGSVFLVFVYLFLLMRIIFIAERQRSSFNRIYAYCVAMILFYHFAINIGMNIGFVPVIGIPLPFFSYGGSSIMSFCIMMFLLLKLDSQRKDVLR